MCFLIWYDHKLVESFSSIKLLYSAGISLFVDWFVALL